MVIMLVMAICTASFITANQFANDKMIEFKITRGEADGFRAYLLAVAGLQGAMGALKTVPEEMLYMSGIAFNPPPVPLAGGMIYYRMTPEDGKFNLNTIVRTYDDQPNARQIEQLTRIYEQLGIKQDKINAIVDWIDKDSQESGGGAEIFYYSGLKPPRKIKNGPLFTLSELTAVKGYDKQIIYGSSKPKDAKDRSTAFLSEEEKLLITDSDFVLANNITAYQPLTEEQEQKININAAPYHVLMSLSDAMTKQAARKILKIKLDKGGYIKKIEDLEKEPEFQVKTPAGFTLYKELVGEGTDISSGRVKAKGDIYRIIGVGTMKTNIVRKVTCLFDVPNRQVLYYSED